MAASTNRASTSAERHLHAWYELEPKTIGGGAYADVYRARHRLTGRHVAVKIFHANLAVEEGAEREIRIMRLLRHHPHVIRFYEATVVAANVGDRACIVMELAESGELYKELYNQVISSQHGLDEAEVRRMFMQLVSGVAYCHRNMVVHHDLKLENVLLDAGKNVKLADFGFSDFFGPVQKPAADCGSLLYAAPEVCGDRTETTRHLGPEVDMWSCGVILFAMLCGYLPFEGPDEPAIKRRIASGRVRIPFGISDEPRALISGMLQVCPERRMSIDEVRQHPWLQHSIPRYLAVLPPLHAAGQIFKENHICDRSLEQVVRLMVGLDNDNLVEFLHRGVENQATVAYYLMLDKRFDAPTRYMWLLHDPPMDTIVPVDRANTEPDSIPNEVISRTATEES